MTTSQKDILSDSIGPFTALPNRVIRLIPVIGSDAFVVFCALRYFAGTDEVVFPSYDTLHEMTTLRRQRIADGLSALIKYGLVTKTRRFSQSTIYTLHYPTEERTRELLISTTGVLMEDTISTTGVLPLVRQEDTNKTHLTRLINNTCGEEQNPILKTPEQECIERAEQALWEGVLNQGKKGKDCSVYVSKLPDQLRPLAEAFIEATKISPAGRDYGQWRKELQYWYDKGITPDVIRRAVSAMMSNKDKKLFISGPQSITKVAISIMGEDTRANVGATNDLDEILKQKGRRLPPGNVLALPGGTYTRVELAQMDEEEWAYARTGVYVSERSNRDGLSNVDLAGTAPA